MKKIIFTISFALILTSCGTTGKDDLVKDKNTITSPIPLQTERSDKNNNSNTKDFGISNSLTYKIAEAIYVDKNVKIKYPQISESNMQKEVNEIIKKEALKVLNDYKEVDNEFSLEINYEIKWKSPNLISIQYLGSSFVKGEAHPDNLVYTTNININKGILLRLKDLVNINDSFVEKFKKGKYEPWDSGLNLESEGVNTRILAHYTNNELIKYFNEEESYFYFTMDSLGISVGVAHAYGDHAEFEIKYQDIPSNIKAENEIWKDFLHVTQ